MVQTKNLLIACTGSVATIKLSELVNELLKPTLAFIFKIKIISTERAKHFYDPSQLPKDVDVIDDAAEWSAWHKRGDPVLHIDLGKWADLLVISPLSANSLAKIATGICDNMLMCVVRAWDFTKPLLFCPAMNTRMYDHPITREQIDKLKSWGYCEIPCVAKTLMCGDTGNGAMAQVQTIVDKILFHLESIQLSEY